MLRTRADRVVVRIRRHIALLANIYELCLFTEQVDDVPDEMPSYTEPREDPFVFRKDLLRYEPYEGSTL